MATRRCQSLWKWGFKIMPFRLGAMAAHSPENATHTSPEQLAGLTTRTVQGAISNMKMAWLVTAQTRIMILTLTAEWNATNSQHPDGELILNAARYGQRVELPWLQLELAGENYVAAEEKAFLDSNEEVVPEKPCPTTDCFCSQR